MTLTARALVDDLRRRAFAPSGIGAPRLGAEVELIAVDAESRRPAPLRGDGAPDERATLPVLRTFGRIHGWTEEHSAKAGIPSFRTPEGRITFEPGGQIELSAAPVTSLTALHGSLDAVLPALRRALADAGIDTLTVGLDPLNAVDDVPLQLTADRYTRMDRHFASLGPSGARMMRQTASIQICVDSGPRPDDRFRLLNALTPYVVAMFANSSMSEGVPTGHQSTRRAIWGALDPSRTGLMRSDDDPAEEYASFALGAPAILLGADTPPFRPFREWLARATTSDWDAQLSTLFPEVRPRGYFELRSCDALPPESYIAPLVLVSALVYGPDEGRTAFEITGPPDPALLDRAGRCGLGDAMLASQSVELADLALAEAGRLSPGFVSSRLIDQAAAYFERYTRRRGSPALDALAVVGA